MLDPRQLLPVYRTCQAKPRLGANESMIQLYYTDVLKLTSEFVFLKRITKALPHRNLPCNLSVGCWWDKYISKGQGEIGGHHIQIVASFNQSNNFVEAVPKKQEKCNCETLSGPFVIIFSTS